MKVWIDLANSPHPLLFAPICRRLEAEGATVLVTVRDHAQTLELGRERWPEATVIGAGGAATRLSKASALGLRLREMRHWARAEGPDVAVSYNSYAQIVAARSLGIPAVTGMDYEHQPLNHIAFRGARRILLPAAVPAAVVARQGASARKIIRHRGLKEEIYLGDFEPDPEILGRVGFTERPPVLAVARTAAAAAAYHRGDNPLFLDVLRALGSRGDVTTVVLVRLAEQRRAIVALGLPNIVVPETAVDSRSLLAASDLFVGAGGTMTREAALLGVPTFTVFAGRPAAVDGWLENEGMLTRLTSVDQVATIGPAPASSRSLERIRAHGWAIEDAFVGAIKDASGDSR